MNQLLEPVKLDMNLLVVFVLIFQHKSVSKAACSLDLGQPAVSSSLAKLRVFTGDPLFIRTKSGMTPTPRAETLFSSVQPALQAITQAVKFIDRSAGPLA